MTSTDSTYEGPGGSRVLAIDALRGLIMVLMALDHANLFVAQKHSSGEYWGGPFPHYDSALPFLTRAVTHLAAPGFFMLMGAGMALLARRRARQGWDRRRVVRHFWIRGGLLMVLQLAVVNRAWELSPGGWDIDIYIGVLFALGGAMILGSLLVWTRPAALLALALVALFVTELLTTEPALWPGDFTILERILLVPGGDLSLWVNYPILPWFELLLFGMALGHYIDIKREWPRARGLWLGVGLLMVFIIVRGLNGFGNIRPRPGDGWIDFFNLVKYPPSIAFSALTTGVNLSILGLFARGTRRGKPLLQGMAVFGRTPLFFYVTHLFLYAGHGRLLAPQGTSIEGMLPVWLAGLLALFPLCLIYGAIRKRQPAGSPLRYL
jgi:uncharacterized membrane protein